MQSLIENFICIYIGTTYRWRICSQDTYFKYGQYEVWCNCSNKYNCMNFENSSVGNSSWDVKLYQSDHRRMLQNRRNRWLVKQTFFSLFVFCLFWYTVMVNNFVINFFRNRRIYQKSYFRSYNILCTPKSRVLERLRKV